jgi:hypothetical protein
VLILPTNRWFFCFWLAFGAGLRYGSPRMRSPYTSKYASHIRLPCLALHPNSTRNPHSHYQDVQLASHHPLLARCAKYFLKLSRPSSLLVSHQPLAFTVQAPQFRPALHPNSTRNLAGLPSYVICFPIPPSPRRSSQGRRRVPTL